MSVDVDRFFVRLNMSRFAEMLVARSDLEGELERLPSHIRRIRFAVLDAKLRRHASLMSNFEFERRVTITWHYRPPHYVWVELERREAMDPDDLRSFRRIHYWINKPDARCPICLDQLVGETVRLPCEHELHRRCAELLFTTTYKCPLCRRPFGRLTEEWEMDLLRRALGARLMALVESKTDARLRVIRAAEEAVTAQAATPSVDRRTAT